MVDCTPRTLNESFNEIGRPCKGPRVVPVRARWSSHSCARARAESNIVSVKQLTHCWAMAARLQKAVTTSMLLRVPAAMSSTSCVASYFSVISSSWEVSRPHFWGTSRTLSVASWWNREVMEVGRRHAAGMVAARLSRLDWVRRRQSAIVGAEAMIRKGVVWCRMLCGT